MKKLLRAIAWIFFILFLAMLALGLFVTTESGTQILGKVGQRLSPHLKISGLEGSAVHDLKIKQLDWFPPDQQIHVTNLHLRNNLADLGEGVFHVETLTADSLTVVLPERTDSAPSESLLIALPLDVDVENLVVKQLIIKKGDSKHQINDVKLSAHTKNNRIVISGFEAQPLLDGSPVQVKLNGNVNLNAPYDASSDLTLVYQHQKHGKAKASFKLKGDIETYTFTGNADLSSKEYGAGLFEITAKGTDHDLSIQTLKLKALEGTANVTGTLAWGDELQWKLDLYADSLNTKSILPDWPATLSTRFKTEGTLRDDKLKGIVNLETLDGKFQDYPLYAKGKILLDSHQANLEKLNIKALGGMMDTTGTVTWGDKITWDLALNTETLTFDKLLPEWPATLSTELKTKGELKDNKVKGIVDLQKLQGTFQKLPLLARAKIDLDGNQASINELHVEALKGSADSSGSVSWGDELAWDLKLESKNINTKPLLPDWPAVLTTKLTTKGTQKNDKIDALIDLQSLSGKLQGQALSGKGKIQIKDKLINVDKLQISSGRNTLFADGQASEPFNLQWKVEGKKLNQLYKGLGGSLQGNGTLKGTLEKPQVQAKLKGKSLRYQDYRLAAIKLNIKQNRDQYQIDAQLDKLKTADQTIQKLSLDGKGSLEKHTANLSLQHPDADIKLKAKGGWKQKQWKGSVQKLQLDKTAAGNWSLTSPVSITASEKKFSSGKLCLKNQSALACSTNNWQTKSGLQAKGSLQNIPLSLLKPWLPNTVSLAGNANADFNIKQVSGTIKLRLPDSSVMINAKGAKTQQLQYQNAHLDATLKGKNITTSFAAQIKNRGNIAGEAKVKISDKVGRSSIKGQATLELPNISWANEFVPDIQKLRGAVSSQLSVSGSLDKPQIMGKANLINGSFALQETGTEIQNININIVSHAANQANISGSLQSGKGKLTITGNMQLGKADDWKAQVRLQGNNLNFMDTYEIKGVVSPNLTINATPTAVNITGTLSIPETKITLNELPPTAIYESDDVVIVGQGQPRTRGGERRKSKPVPFKIRPNVNIVIGDKVSFSGFGLKTNLSGKFRIREHQQELFAQGSVKISNGVYKAYGQDLEITQGRLVFNGPVDNPGMDIKAVRKLPDVEAGIHLTGTVQKPETRLFSNPAQSQTDILSYLLTGRKLSEASGDESGMLLSAITSLGISGGEGIARNIGTSLGLDDININSENGLESSELELGKRLGPNLYLKYIVGLFDAMQRIAIEYRVNKRLTLEAQSGVNQGFDLIYKMERD